MSFQFYWPSWYKWWRISYYKIPDSICGWQEIHSKVLCIGPLQFHWYGH